MSIAPNSNDLNEITFLRSEYGEDAIETIVGQSGKRKSEDDIKL